MNNSNSYNVCTRCGTPNSLSARYCYQCGGQLKVPEQPVVCEKCNTVNTGMANFCRNCGSTLKIGALTKKCPRCDRQVDQENSQCACGYSFAGTSTIKAKDKSGETVDVRTGKKHKELVATGKSKPRRAGGRVLGFFSLLIALAVAVLYALPLAYRPDWLASIYIIGGSSNSNLVELGLAIYSGGFGALSLGEWVLYGAIALMALCLALHIIVAFVRMLAGCRPKHANWWYLIFAVISAVAIALPVCAATTSIVTVVPFVSMFAVSSDIVYGWLLYGVPAYFFVVFLLSFIAKRKKAKNI